MQIPRIISKGVKLSRRDQILAALAKMLTESPGERITTAALAKLVGVSEAALYRHFPSKTKMFEGLIEFIEDTLFTQINLMLTEQHAPITRCELMIAIVLRFAEEHPGLSRLLVGDALTGETARLRQRIVQVFKRLEGELLQLLNPAEARATVPSATLVDLLMAYTDGVIVQFVRSEFQTSPSVHWRQNWQTLAPLLFPLDQQA